MREVGSAGNIIFDATSMANGFKGNQLHGVSPEVEASKNKMEPRVEMPKNEGASRFGLGNSILHGVTLGARNWLRKSQYDLEVHNEPFEIPKNEEWFQTMLKGLSDSVSRSWEIEPNIEIGEFSVSYMNEIGQTKRLNHKSKPPDLAAFLGDRENWQEISKEQGRALVNRIIRASGEGKFYMTEDHKMNLIELMEMSGIELEGEAKKREGHHLDREWLPLKDGRRAQKALPNPVDLFGSWSDGKAKSVELVDRLADYGNTKYLTPEMKKDADAMRKRINEIESEKSKLRDGEFTKEEQEIFERLDAEKKVLLGSFGRTEYARRKKRNEDWFKVAAIVGPILLLPAGVPLAASGLVIAAADSYWQREEATNEFEYNLIKRGDPPEVAEFAAGIYRVMPFLSEAGFYGIGKFLGNVKNLGKVADGLENSGVKNVSKGSAQTLKEFCKTVDGEIIETPITIAAEDRLNHEHIARSISWVLYNNKVKSQEKHEVRDNHLRERQGLKLRYPKKKSIDGVQ